MPDAIPLYLMLLFEMYFQQTSKSRDYLKEEYLKGIFGSLFSEEEIAKAISQLIIWDRVHYIDGEITLSGGINSAEKEQYELWAKDKINLSGNGS